MSGYDKFVAILGFKQPLAR